MVWLFGSSNSGPSLLGPYPVAFSSDFWIMGGPITMPSSGMIQFPPIILASPAYAGIEGVFQAGAYDLLENAVTFSAGVLHRVHASNGNGQRVLIVRQISYLSEAPHATTAADTLAQDLQARGYEVAVEDDFIPEDLASFDVIVDARYTFGVTEAEKVLLSRFLQRYGGVFVLGGGSTSPSPGGDYRFQSLRQWMQMHLGIATAIQATTGLSAGTSEEVFMVAHPNYLSALVGTLPMPYRVENESADFGVIGAQQSGTPWIVSDEIPPRIYGMQFTSADISAFPVRGNLAVLFNGAADALSGDDPAHQGREILQALIPFLDQ
jgi:hypothetical protein